MALELLTMVLLFLCLGGRKSLQFFLLNGVVDVCSKLREACQWLQIRRQEKEVWVSAGAKGG